MVTGALTAARFGDEAAWTGLYREHFARLSWLALLLGADDPDDIAQEAFVRLHQRRRRLRDPQAAVAYLRRTVVNLTRNRIRHLGVARRHAAVRQVQATMASAEDAAVAGEDQRRILSAMRRLTPRHREALVLRYWLDLSEAQMAAAMGCSPGTVKSHVSRGLAELAHELEEN